MSEDEINLEDEVVVGFLIQREAENGDLSFWHPETKWTDDPNEAMLYEDEDVAEDTADKLQAEDESTEITVAVVIEDDEEDDEDEEEA
ncbi:hypothetical protein [Acetobacter sp.]|jgi:hypothetical protein|uniref:hypothetical protein n=1 Tax=Acetobacter sp. TaxID=440 RepID=UPI0025C4B6DC|nr:hypothetical protein [Acetobacter sp.]MCH4090631.1 hypothetical protein [Acetobacter sp.]MCI1300074.1 hypothetical protein [Acetobacter sp.]MCI1316492.1 hypothetical protein [Acetobacter sp.]